MAQHANAVKRPVDMVGLYAKLDLQRERYIHAGQPVPEVITRGIQGIEARANSMLTPQQLSQAQVHVHNAKQRLIATENRVLGENFQRNDAKIDRDAVSDFTKGFFNQGGLTRRQWEDLKVGNKVKLTQRHPQMTAEQLNAETVKRTKPLDPAGRGFTAKQWEGKLDALADAKSQKEYDRLCDSLRVNPKQIDRVVDQWRDDRYSYELQKRLSKQDVQLDEEIEPTDRDQLRATIMQSYADNVETEEQAKTQFDSISDDYLEDDGLRGDIANAMAFHESIEDEDHA